MVSCLIFFPAMPPGLVDIIQHGAGGTNGYGFPCPTTIQKYAWPCLLSKKDFIGVSPTGSGKTLAYLVPAFISAKILEVGR